MTSGPAPPPDLLVLYGTVLTQDPERRVLENGGIAVSDGAILEVGSAAALKVKWPHVSVLDASECLVTPGLINSHQHLTADPLVRCLIPDRIDTHAAIFDWATPLHGAVGGDDDELSATLSSLESLHYGTTTLIEAGTVAHPDRVAAGMAAGGIRGGVGCWGWDTPGLPYSAPAREVLARQEAVLKAFPRGGQIEGWVTLVGHDLASDELLAGAADLSRRRGAGLTFHISPTEADVLAYIQRGGLRPLAHLHRLGVLGEHLLLAHAVWLDDEELELLIETRSAVAYCPWAYLRLGQGVTRAGRHADLIRRNGRIALGCDSANAGDIADIHRAAALAVGLARDMEKESQHVTAAVGLDLATRRGADAIGLGEVIGSIEGGKHADLVVHDLKGPSFRPFGDPMLNLIWGTDGRSVRDVIVAGKIVIRRGESTLVDEEELSARAKEAQLALLRRADL